MNQRLGLVGQGQPLNSGHQGVLARIGLGPQQPIEKNGYAGRILRANASSAGVIQIVSWVARSEIADAGYPPIKKNAFRRPSRIAATALSIDRFCGWMSLTFRSAAPRTSPYRHESPNLAYP